MPASASASWQADLKLGFRPGGGRTLLAERRRRGPLAVQRPFYPEGPVCHVYLLHPPGGVVGGDRLQIATALAAGSQVLATTPGATKFYRSAGAVAQQTQILRLGPGASLEWLPQENILFPGAQLHMQTRIDLAADAHLAWWEIQCLGRPAIGEAFDAGYLDAGLQIRRDGRPLLIERLRVDARSRLRGALLAARPVSATAVFSVAGEAELATARAILDDDAARDCGVTLVDGLLLLRYLGDSTERARGLLTRIWSALREPLLARPAAPPRIWNT